MRKNRENKKEESYCSIELNEKVLRERGLLPSEVKKPPKSYLELSKMFEGLDENTFFEKEVEVSAKRPAQLVCAQVPTDLLLLKGEKGEVAWVRRDSNYDEGTKHSLVIEFLLSLTLDEQGEWLSRARRFFKALFIAELESVHSGDEFRFITDKPYKECDYREVKRLGQKKGTQAKVRYRTYAHSATYGSKSGIGRDRLERNKWIQNRYRQLKKDKNLCKDFVRFCEIKEELTTMEFGRAKCKDLSTERIRSIIYRKK